MRIEVWVTETKKGRTDGFTVDFRRGGERLFVSQHIDVGAIIASYALNHFGPDATLKIHWPEEPSVA